MVLSKILIYSHQQCKLFVHRMARLRLLTTPYDVAPLPEKIAIEGHEDSRFNPARSTFGPLRDCGFITSLPFFEWPA